MNGVVTDGRSEGFCTALLINGDELGRLGRRPNRGNDHLLAVGDEREQLRRFAELVVPAAREISR